MDNLKNNKNKNEKEKTVDENTAKKGDSAAFKNSRKTVRSPSKPTANVDERKISSEKAVNESVKSTVQLNNEQGKNLQRNSGDATFYYNWQSEIKARKQLEKTVKDLQEIIKKLEKKVDLLSKANTQASNISTPAEDEEFHTEEDELDYELGGWTKFSNKRQTKKRKAVGSPEMISEHKEHVTKGDNSKKKEHTPPPIMVHGVEKFGVLRENIQKVTAKECKYTSYNNNLWKINVEDSETYRAISGELTRKEIQWHSYEDKATRPIKVVARGLHSSCDEAEIVEYLKEKDFKILEAINISKRERTEGTNGGFTVHKKRLPLFVLTFDRQESIEKIYAMKAILNIVVKIEPFRKTTNDIPQCQRCQAFGHTKRYCNKKAACVKCAGKHLTNACTLDKKEKAKCVNCGGEHPASYRGCPTAKKQQEWQSAQTKRQNQNRIPKDAITKNPTTNINPVETGKSYSQIVKNVRKEEENSVKGMLNLILQRLDQQDETIKALSDDMGRVKTNSNQSASNNNG